MAMKPRLETPEKIRILALRMQGYTMREIGETVGCSPNAVSYNLMKYEENGDFEERKHPGAPEKLQDRDKRYLIRQVLLDPTITSEKAATQFNENQPLHKHISPNYVRKFWQKSGLGARVRPKKWFISQINKRKRVKWVKDHQDNPIEYWQNIVFSDESLIKAGAGRRYIRIRREGPSPSNFAREINRQGIKVMVWGSISYHGAKVLRFIDHRVTGRAYKQTLEQNLFRIYPRLRTGELLFQHDNAPAHRSAIVVNYLHSSHIKTLPWPAQSPDLNVIENVWAFIKRGLKDNYRNAQELRNDIQRIWDGIDITYIQALYDSIPNRLRSVLEARGGPTKY